MNDAAQARASADTAARVARLERMRAIATGLLLVMAAVFVAAGLLAHRWPAVAYVQAFAEAAMVGACADWFAVTALFRRPLGLPIPHTGVIPRNKDRIGQALGRFIADNFLTVRVLDQKLRQLELAAWGGGWLRRPQNARALSRRLAALAPEILPALSSSAAQAMVGSVAFAAARSAPAAPIASALLSAAWNEGRGQALVDRAAALLGDYLSSHQEVILEQVQAQSAKWLPAWVDKIIAQKITVGLIQLLSDVREPDHPWRVKIAAGVEAYIDRLAHDPDLRARGEALKLKLLSDPLLRGHAGALWSELERRLGSDLRDHAEEIAEALERGLLALGTWLSDDPGVQRALNTWARSLVRRVIAPRRHEIGLFVAQVVSGWDTDSMVEKLELQVGPDLQYIRINGTLVGGLVGLLLYALSRALGLS